MDVTVPLHSEEEERALMGPRDAYARAVRNRFGVTIQVRKGRLFVEGDEEDVSDAVHVMRALLARLRDKGELDESAVSEVLDNGGSISHHHGVGKIRQDFMAEALSEDAARLLRDVKRSLDPGNVFGIRNNVMTDA